MHLVGFICEIIQGCTANKTHKPHLHTELTAAGQLLAETEERQLFPLQQKHKHKHRPSSLFNLLVDLIWCCSDVTVAFIGSFTRSETNCHSTVPRQLPIINERCFSYDGLHFSLACINLITNSVIFPSSSKYVAEKRDIL